MMATQQQDYKPKQQRARLQVQLRHQRSPTVLSCKEHWMKLQASNHSYQAWRQR
jgi:hypothetical protein